MHSQSGTGRHHSQTATAASDGQIAVLGAGSWGTALAMQLARNGQQVVLWGRDAELIAEIRDGHENRRYLPGIRMPDMLRTSTELESLVRASADVLLVCPSHAMRELLQTIRPWLQSDAGVCWACKGFEPGSGRLLHEVASEVLGSNFDLAVVTGPSFAREVALDMPTAVTVAASSESFGARIARRLHGGSFRAYYSDDMIGAELGGAVKNVMAIATGIADGMALGSNARAGMITRGLGEILRLGEAMGAQQKTLIGLAGLGDLVLTCTGDLSRNRRLGLALGQGMSAHQAMLEIGQVVEGYKAAAEVERLRQQYQLDLPISEQVYGILYQHWSPQKGLQVLLNRELKKE